MSAPFLLTGLFAGPHLLWIGGVCLGVGMICAVLAWGLYKGYLWAWCGAVLLTLPSMVLAWWMNQAGFQLLFILSVTLLMLQLAVLFLLWRAAVRRWFAQTRRLRSSGYVGGGGLVR